MVDQNLRGVLGYKYKSYNYGSSCSQTSKQKHIDDLETLAQYLQHHLRLYEDHNYMENLMEGIGKYKIKEENYDFCEETLQPSQLEGFLEHKKVIGMYARYYDGRCDGHYRNGEYYKRRGNYDEDLRFNPKLNILEFDGRMDADEFFDWLNMVEHIFGYYDRPEHKNVKLVAIKMCKNASIWWENLKRRHERDSKKKIQTWKKMKELKMKYLSFNYHQNIYLKFQNFKHQDLSVEEYSAKFVNLIIK